MEVSYQKVSSTAETVDIDDEDVMALQEIAKASFVDRIRVIGMHNPLLNGEKQAKAICEKYGVDPDSKVSVVNFLKAALGVDPELLRQSDL